MLISSKGWKLYRPYVMMQAGYDYTNLMFTKKSSGSLPPLHPLRAKLFRGNKNIYLRFISFFHTDMTQVVEIRRQVRKELIYST